VGTLAPEGRVALTCVAPLVFGLLALRKACNALSAFCNANSASWRTTDIRMRSPIVISVVASKRLIARTRLALELYSACCTDRSPGDLKVNAPTGKQKERPTCVCRTRLLDRGNQTMAGFTEERKGVV
jgi:hypothetical protein